MSRLSPQVHPLLTDDVTKALHVRQIFTVLDFLRADAHQIADATRITFKEVLALKSGLSRKFGATPINGLNLYRATLTRTAILPTGIESVDKQLLNGGLFTGKIYEICGLPASGKTQFTLTMMKHLTCNTSLNLLYFDTKNDFSAIKLRTMLKSQLKSADPNREMALLNKILVKKAHSIWDLINGLYEVKDKLKNDDFKLRLIIIDSLPALLMSTNNHMAQNNSYLNHFVNIMRYISVEHHVAFLITNLITRWSDGDFKNRQEAIENVTCGKYWFSVPNFRLKIDKTEGVISHYEISDFNEKDKKSVKVVLTEEGFV